MSESYVPSPQNAEAPSSSLPASATAPPRSGPSGRVPLQPLASISQDVDDNHDFTEEQVDEYREQDRFLPVSLSRLRSGWMEEEKEERKKEKGERKLTLVLI